MGCGASRSDAAPTVDTMIVVSSPVNTNTSLEPHRPHHPHPAIHRPQLMCTPVLFTSSNINSNSSNLATPQSEPTPVGHPRIPCGEGFSSGGKPTSMTAKKDSGLPCNAGYARGAVPPTFGLQPSPNVAPLMTPSQRRSLSEAPPLDLLDDQGVSPCMKLTTVSTHSQGGGSAPQPPLEDTPRQRRRSSVRTSNLSFPQRPDELDIASEAKSPRFGGTSPRPASLERSNSPATFHFADTFEQAEEAEEAMVEFVSMLPPTSGESFERPQVRPPSVFPPPTSLQHCTSCNAMLVVHARFCHTCGQPAPSDFTLAVNKPSFSDDPLTWSVISVGQGCGDSTVDGPDTASLSSELPQQPQQKRCESVKVYHRQVKMARGDNGVLGRGTKGWTYKAIDATTGKPLAVKEMTLDLTDQVEVRNIRSELRHLSTIRHPHVVEYLGCMVDAEHHIVRILMERLECGTLEDLLRQFRSGIPEDAIRTLTAQLLEAIMHCHELGTTHRDVKPANILQSATGTIKLADFGCALLSSKKHVEEEDVDVAGTPAYMPPEIIDVAKRREMSFECSVAHDIWSIGCTVHELLTGKKPWGHLGLEPVQLLMTMKSLGPFPVCDDLSDVAKDFLKHCLQSEMSMRPTARQLLSHPFVASFGSPA